MHGNVELLLQGCLILSLFTGFTNGIQFLIVQLQTAYLVAAKLGQVIGDIPREIFLWICRADQGEMGHFLPGYESPTDRSIRLPGYLCGDTERRLNPSFLPISILRLNKWFVPNEKRLIHKYDQVCLYLWVSNGN